MCWLAVAKAEGRNLQRQHMRLLNISCKLTANAQRNIPELLEVARDALLDDEARESRTWAASAGRGTFLGGDNALSRS